MPNPFYYRSVLNNLARRADAPYPPHVRVAAACALARELTPGTERARLAQQMLAAANPYEHARHLLRDLYDRGDSLSLPSFDAADPTTTQQDDAAEEDDDPL